MINKQRIALGLEYDGQPFSGWQVQPNKITVQGCLDQALTTIAAEPIKVIASGRTDAGVHGLRQVVHFDTSVKRDQAAWTVGVNNELPNSIRVQWMAKVSTEFHARYSANNRTYHYFLSNQAISPGILRHHIAWFRNPLDVNVMQQAAKALEGEHDFTSFRSGQCEAKTPIRQLDTLSMTQKNGLFIFELTANAFLHHMVRNIVGALMMVGSGKETIQWLADVLVAKDQRLNNTMAPACGLYLTHVHYPADFGLPSFTNGLEWCLTI